jgi:sugar lactone lactonase YvrE
MSLGLSRCASAVGAASVLLAGCGALPLSLSKGQDDVQPPIGVSQAMAQRQDLSSYVLRNDSPPHLFVASLNGNHHQGHISEYQSGKSQPSKVFANAVDRPNALGIDGAGNLYVANNGAIDKPGSVSVYSPLTGQLLRTITNGVNTPDALALDESGNVYVANFLKNSVTEYAAGTTRLVRTITSGVGHPNAMIIDVSGKVYVADYSGRHAHHGAVTVYDGHTGKLLKTITSGVVNPGDLAFSSGGELFVSDNVNNSVTVYNRDLALSRKITTGIDYPTELQIDEQGYLYVLNVKAGKSGDVTVYAPGASSPSVTIADGVHDPNDMKLDPSGALFVANGNAHRGSVTVYSRPTFKLLREINAGIDNAGSLVFGP